MQNAKTVEAIYQAFGLGDVNTLLGYVSPDVEWDYGPLSVSLPCLKSRYGHAGVVDFLSTLVQEFEIRRFAPLCILQAQDARVVSVVDVEVRLRRTGEILHEPEEVHLFHFDAAGRVKKFRHQLDTHRMWQAFAKAEVDADVDVDV